MTETTSAAAGLAGDSYGADEHGLICGFRFAPGHAPEPVRRLADAGVAPPRGFVWLHLNLSHAGALPWLKTHGGLPESFFDAVGDGSSRSTRIERDGDALFAVINDVTFDFTFDASDVATLWLRAEPGRVISARHHPLRAIDRLRTAVKGGEELPSSVSLLEHLLRDQADELQRIARRAADRLDDIEDEVLAGHHGRHTLELARLRRLMVRLQRLLAPEPSALRRTLSTPPRWIGEEDLASLNRADDEFALVLRDVASLQERIKLLQDESATRVQEENSRSLFMLSMVTVLALPINLVAGLMGMNVGGVPFGQQPHGFWWTLALILALTGFVAWAVWSRLRPRG